MMWILCGLGASLFWAATNVIDQVLIRRFYEGKSLLVMTLCGFVSFIPFIAIGLYDTSVFSVSNTTAFLFVLTSLINSCGFLAYFKALEIDEASNAIPLFQLQPVFVFIAAYFLFSETITLNQGIGVAIIIISALSIVIDFENKKYNWKTLYYIGICGIVLSLTTLLDRYLLEDLDFITGTFWKSLGYVCFSIIVILAHKSTRVETFERIKDFQNQGILLLIVVSLLGILGDISFLASLDLTTATGLAVTLTGFMPFFVLGLGYLGYKIAPNQIKKPKQGFHLGFHLSCLTVMLFGLYLIY